MEILQYSNGKEKPKCFTSPAHGLTMLGTNANVPLPGYMDPSGKPFPASSLEGSREAFGLIKVTGVDSLCYLPCGGFVKAASHGFTIGDILYLQDDGSLGSSPGTLVQKIFEVVDNDCLMSLCQPMCGNGGDPVSTLPCPDIEILDNPNNGSDTLDFPVSAGDSRLLVVQFVADSSTGVFSPVASATYGGQPMTLVKATANDGGGFKTDHSVWIIDEAGIAAAVGSTIIPTHTPASNFETNIYAMSLINVEQSSPVASLAASTVQGVGEITQILSAPADGVAIIAVGQGNDAVTPTFSAPSGVTFFGPVEDDSDQTNASFGYISGPNNPDIYTYNSSANINRGSFIGIGLNKCNL